MKAPHLLFFAALSVSGLCLVSACGPKRVVSATPAATPIEAPPSTDDAFNAAFGGPASTSADAGTVEVDSDELERQAYRSRLETLEQQLRSNRLDDAKRAWTELRKKPSPGPAEEQRAQSLAAQLFWARKEAGAARGAIRDWLRACGPSEVAACRTAALEAAVPMSAGKDGEAFAAELGQLRLHDECLAAAERSLDVEEKAPAKGAVAGKAAVKPKATQSPKAPATTASQPPSETAAPLAATDASCLGAALSSYEKAGDALMVARVKLVEARQAQRTAPKAEPTRDALTAAEAACHAVRCIPVRQEAFRRLAALHLARGEDEAATRATLAAMHAGAEAMSPANRPYQRTADADKVCKAYDAKRGKGQCRALEKTAFGFAMAQDFSQEKSPVAYLEVATLKRVLSHFQPTLDDCIGPVAARHPPSKVLTFSLHWVVRPDGRVESASVEANTTGEKEVESCLRSAVRGWRYPHFAGEAQNVRQTFSVRGRQGRP